MYINDMRINKKFVDKEKKKSNKMSGNFKLTIDTTGMSDGDFVIFIEISIKKKKKNAFYTFVYLM